MTPQEVAARELVGVYKLSSEWHVEYTEMKNFDEDWPSCRVQRIGPWSEMSATTAEIEYGEGNGAKRCLGRRKSRRSVRFDESDEETRLGRGVPSG